MTIVLYVITSITFLIIVILVYWNIKLQRRISRQTGRLKEANQMLNQLARTDALTGLYNRQVFNEMIEQQSARFQRFGYPISLLLIDVDYFKKYNNTYGHQKGDECLMTVAAVIRSAVKRRTDTIARYSGGEFAVILEETDSKSAFTLADAIHINLQKQNKPHESSPFLIVTISAGVVTLQKKDKSQDNINVSSTDLLKMADEALHEAKSAGRNQVKQFKQDS